MPEYKINEAMNRIGLSLEWQPDDSVRHAEKPWIQEDQMAVFHTIRENAREAIGKNEKRVLIVKGGPGTGKSLIAMYTAAALRNELLDKNVYYLSKNAAPRNVYGKKFAGTNSFFCMD